jgi:two-component system phosphate regulon sensor histidine kinase PhoR
VVNFRGESAGTLIQLEDVTSDYKTDQLKNQYLSIVAHELRTPLTGIKTFSTMLSKGTLGELSDRQGQVVESIREQSLRLEHQIDKLVNLGHLESDEVGQDQELADFAELVGQAVLPFETVARDKGLRFDCSLPDAGEAMVRCDRSAVRRAVQALVENAVKFSSGDGAVAVAVEPAPDADGWRLLVRDRGCGIDVRYHRRIFDKFFQVEDPLTRHHGGSGLGLFFVKSIVEAHRSKVVVESELGAGATFSFALARPELALANDSGASEASAQTPTTRTTSQAD